MPGDDIRFFKMINIAAPRQQQQVSWEGAAVSNLSENNSLPRAQIYTIFLNQHAVAYKRHEIQSNILDICDFDTIVDPKFISSNLTHYLHIISTWDMACLLPYHIREYRLYFHGLRKLLRQQR